MLFLPSLGHWRLLTYTISLLYLAQHHSLFFLSLVCYLYMIFVNFTILPPSQMNKIGLLRFGKGYEETSLFTKKFLIFEKSLIIVISTILFFMLTSDFRISRERGIKNGWFFGWGTEIIVTRTRISFLKDRTLHQ